MERFREKGALSRTFLTRVSFEARTPAQVSGLFVLGLVSLRMCSNTTAGAPHQRGTAGCAPPAVGVVQRERWTCVALAFEHNLNETAGRLVGNQRRREVT